jgi:hypothetical protein
MVFMLWRVLLFLKPIILERCIPALESLYNKHIELVDSTKANLEVITAEVKGQTAMLDEQSQQLKNHAQELKDHGTRIIEIHRHVVKGDNRAQS